ncbi:small nuclear ribonucleoprotein Sm D3 [Microsporum ferrugineum]
MGKLTSTIGIPIKLLNEAQGHVITLEITSGHVYRGKLLEGARDPQSNAIRYMLPYISIFILSKPL